MSDRTAVTDALISDALAGSPVADKMRAEMVQGINMALGFIAKSELQAQRMIEEIVIPASGRMKWKVFINGDLTPSVVFVNKHEIPLWVSEIPVSHLHVAHASYRQVMRALAEKYKSVRDGFEWMATFRPS